jgi:outer membrane immunogenic protein
MKKFLVASLALVAFAAPAFAADMPTKARMATPVAYNWSGFYIGANVGYASARFNPGLANAPDPDHLKGVFGGGQIGYNRQALGSPLVLGIEADFQASGQKQDVSFTAPAGTVNQKAPWFGTVRGRVGYAPGAWMIYATGGWAYTHYEASINIPTAFTAAGSKDMNGWTLGGGVEWMFMPRWSAKAEYLYMDFGNQAVNLPTSVGPVIPYVGNVKNSLGRVGINYHF